MRPLKDLPVWVVVRLCTNDEKIVDYWNRVDEELELSMDVLDDLGGEVWAAMWRFCTYPTSTAAQNGLGARSLRA